MAGPASASQGTKTERLASIGSLNECIDSVYCLSAQFEVTTRNT